MNIIDGINEELIRANELLNAYRSIPAGAFGVIMIEQVIEQAEDSLHNGDAVEMVEAYAALQALGR